MKEKPQEFKATIIRDKEIQISDNSNTRGIIGSVHLKKSENHFFKIIQCFITKYSSIQNLIIGVAYTVFAGYINMRLMSSELVAEEE